MWSCGRNRQDHIGARIGLAELRIGDAVGVTIRKAEIGALFTARQPIEFILRNVVAHIVSAIVGEPERPGGRMPVKADGIAHAARDHLHTAAGEIVAANIAVDVWIDLADVAGCTDGDVELAVRAESGIAPTVMTVGRQIELLGNIDPLRPIEPCLDVVETIDAIDRGHVERPILHGEAVGAGECLRDGADLTFAVLAGDRINTARARRADKDRALGAEQQRSRAGQSRLPDFDLETRWQLEAIDRRT